MVGAGPGFVRRKPLLTDAGRHPAPGTRHPAPGAGTRSGARGGNAVRCPFVGTAGIGDRRLVRPQERVGVKGDGPERGRVTEAAGAELPCHFGSRRGTIAPKAVSY
ncbi:hypothetical protein SSP531S_52920 [Streptomyces spongiicola]|uniref:Uncharacterized protein n=1 Tax=Streptomyces spongiicola TaxID=1690221 RepID=A0A388T6I1_9ACTN|nr:hypothetical protein SSP531S_52920 [Streptomyces spongiicola]